MFKYQIQINKNLPSQYTSCFNDADYGQQVINTLDTALLAKDDKTDELTLEDLAAPLTIASAASNATAPNWLCYFIYCIRFTIIY